jgi:hypothetical protein
MISNINYIKLSYFSIKKNISNDCIFSDKGDKTTKRVRGGGAWDIEFETTCGLAG